MLSILLFSIVSTASALNTTTQTGTYKYDSAGNLLQDDRYYYEYNNFNQLIKVRQGNSVGKILLDIYYSPEGQRIKKVSHVNNTDTTTYYISPEYVETITNGNTSIETYYYLNGQIVSREDNTGKYYYYSDHLGGTNIITDEQGNLVEEITYYPFGYMEDGGASRFTYTGKELDPETDLMYYESRYYSPFTGRFTQPDTIIPDMYDSQSLNRSSYARNNPLKYTDPTGHILWDIADVGFAAMDIKNLIQDPSWANAGWAALSVLSLLPILPNIAGYAHYGSKAVKGADNLLSGARKTEGLVGDAGRIMKDAGVTDEFVEFEGKKIHTIDYDKTSIDFYKTRGDPQTRFFTAQEATSKGLAPKINGDQITLHHIGQSDTSDLAMLPKSVHSNKVNQAALHPKTNIDPAQKVNRQSFNEFRERFWKWYSQK